MHKKNCVLMAHYNQWMNGNLLQCAAKLSADELNKNMGAFFGSILGTLNHLLVADLIWLNRFATHPANFSSLIKGLKEFEKPSALDQVLCSKLSELESKSSLHEVCFFIIAGLLIRKFGCK